MTGPHPPVVEAEVSKSNISLISNDNFRPLQRRTGLPFVTNSVGLYSYDCLGAQSEFAEARHGRQGLIMPPPNHAWKFVQQRALLVRIKPAVVLLRRHEPCLERRIHFSRSEKSETQPPALAC